MSSNNLPGDSSLPTVIIRADAINMWRDGILPFIQAEFEADGVPDYPARSESFNNWTDMLCKDGRISEWQYNNWTHPVECGS